MGDDFKTSSTMTGSDYWAAYVGGAKIKIDNPKRQIWTKVITYPLMTYLSADNIVLEFFRNSYSKI